MNTRWVCHICSRHIHPTRSKRSFTTCFNLLQKIAPVVNSRDSHSVTRNIGIIAHIDAGKTTTTERMLYYSGFTRRIGDVDDGSTVTDFLPAERARGITIQSAAITFYWPQKTQSNAADNPPHTVNLIDTPGHADFTFEVVRSLRILDGAICILDGVAGVEAQTEKVWHQANNYRIPRIIYVNKLDRDGASFHMTVNEIASRLHTFPALCQIPWWRHGKFIGLGDVINLRALEWENGSDGSNITRFNVPKLEEKDPIFLEELKKARIALIEALTEHDDELVEAFLESNEDWLAITPSALTKSLRKTVLKKGQVLTPVFVGASFRNIGVQPLLDAVNALLPSPRETVDPEISLASGSSSLRKLLDGQVTASTAPTSKAVMDKDPAKKQLTMVQKLTACALAFKVVMDPKRGALVYVRVYQGSINRSDLVYNTVLATSERAQRLLRMYASEAVEIDHIGEGQIGVIAGLKHARTGDTLIVYAGANQKTGPPTPLKTLQLRPIEVPPPLFYTSIEPHSLTEERHLSECLEQLLREDPSLHVSIDPESGQTHLAGMGELHLEIARDRLLNDFKVKASTSKIEIGYRETIRASSSVCDVTIDRVIAGKNTKASCQASVEKFDESRQYMTEEGPHHHVIQLSESNILMIRHPKLFQGGEPVGDATPLPSSLSLEVVFTAIQTGVSAALAQGPTHRFPVNSTIITVNFDQTEHLDSTTTTSAISSAAKSAVQDALKSSADKANTVMMEPVMMVDITVNDEALGKVVHDLNSARGGHVLSLDADAEQDEDTEAPIAGEVQRLSVEQLKKVYAPRDPFGSSGSSVANMSNNSQQRQIRARVPLKEMVGYLKHLRSLTGGRGTFVMSVDRYEDMNAQRMKAALAEMQGTHF